VVVCLTICVRLPVWWVCLAWLALLFAYRATCVYAVHLLCAACVKGDAIVERVG